ncbi:MAG: hypothetical protein Q4D04_08825, partial [Clostridia bacterium]|nr:hypothetical protein [Clostridia bacterium]
LLTKFGGTMAKLNIDLERVEQMAARFCRREEIAKALGFDVAAFEKKDALAAFEKGRNTACVLVRNMLLDAASTGDRQAIVFLARNELGYTDGPSGGEGDAAPMIIDDVKAREPNG